MRDKGWGSVGDEKHDTDHNPGLFDQCPGKNPGKRPLLPVTPKMAEPF